MLSNPFYTYKAAPDARQQGCSDDIILGDRVERVQNLVHGQIELVDEADTWDDASVRSSRQQKGEDSMAAS